MDKHTVTDGYTTLTRESATPGELFDLAHDLLDRLDGLEWAFMCAVLLTLRHMEVISDPDDPRAADDTLAELHNWLRRYQHDRERIERDHQFLESPE